MWPHPHGPKWLSDHFIFQTEDVGKGKKAQTSPPPLLGTCPRSHPPEFPQSPLLYGPSCKEIDLYSGFCYLWRRGEWISCPVVLSITAWTVSPAIKFTLLSFTLWQILRPCMPTPFLEPVKFMTIFCHFFLVFSRNLNHDGVSRKGRLAPRRNGTSLSNRQWTLEFLTLATRK